MGTALELSGDSPIAQPGQGDICNLRDDPGGEMAMGGGVINDKGGEGSEDAHKFVRELNPLVAMPPPSTAAVTNRLSKQAYNRLGRNTLFEAQPAVSLWRLLGWTARELPWRGLIPVGVGIPIELGVRWERMGSRLCDGER